MSSSQKLHHYLCHANFKDQNSEINLNKDMTFNFSLPTNKITKTFLNGLSETVRSILLEHHPTMNLYDIRINSISYLGEMTEEEFNS